jgi:hypothetical protein
MNFASRHDASEWVGDWDRLGPDLSRDRASERFNVRAEFGQAGRLVGQPFATTDFRRALSATVRNHAKFAVTVRFHQMIEVDPALAKQLRHQS